MLSFPKIISGCIGDAAQPGSEWRQWRQIVGLLDAIQPTQYAIPLETGVFNARLFVRLMMLEESEKNDDRNRHA
jgi:hypothetical protein